MRELGGQATEERCTPGRHQTWRLRSERDNIALLPERKFKLLVCRGPECGDKLNSRALYDRFRRLIDENQLSARVELGWQSCFGRCRQGPNCLIRERTAPAGEQRFLFTSLTTRRGLSALYNGVTRADVDELVSQHIIGGRIVRRLVKRPTLAASPTRSPENSK